MSFEEARKGFFLFKHTDLFQDFAFFLEIKLGDESYITVHRSVKEAYKISFKRHRSGHQDFSALPLSEWDHQNIPFDRARKLLDGILDWRTFNPWTFRQGLGYLLRTQNDFQDVFQLHKFTGSHADWKPFIAHILGFNAQLATDHYEKEKQLKEKNRLSRHSGKNWENL